MQTSRGVQAIRIDHRPRSNGMSATTAMNTPQRRQIQKITRLGTEAIILHQTVIRPDVEVARTVSDNAWAMAAAK